VPRDETQLIDWLYEWWGRIDAWITTTSAAAQAADAARRTGAPDAARPFRRLRS
jgi:hypothetical protein